MNRRREGAPREKKEDFTNYLGLLQGRLTIACHSHQHWEEHAGAGGPKFGQARLPIASYPRISHDLPQILPESQRVCYLIKDKPRKVKMYKTRKPLLLAAAAVVAAGSVAAYLYFKGIPGKLATPLDSAQVVPDEALMAAFISADSHNWSKFQQFGSKEAQLIIAERLQNFQARLRADTNIDFQKDLQPWVGGVMFALLPAPASGEASEPNLLMVVGIKNKLKALEFATRLKAQKQATVEESQYKGISVSTVKEQDGTRYSTAVLGDYLVLAFQTKVLEAAIDTFKGDPSLASTAGATEALAESAGVENPIAQVYLKDYAGLVRELLLKRADAPKVPVATLKQLEQVKSAVMGVGIDGDGLRMKALAQFDSQAIKRQFKPAPGKVVAQFPAETVALVSGYGINQYWSELVSQSKDNPELKKSVQQIRQSVKQAVNINADKEIFGWMDGEFALGAISSGEGMLAQVGFGGALVIETSNRKTAESTWQKLDALAKRTIPFIAIEPRKVNKIEVREWKSPQGVMLGRGWLNKNTMFVALGGPLVDAIAGTAKVPLNSSPNFKAIAGSLPNPNQGYFYLDMEKTLPVVSQLSIAAGTPLAPDASALLNSIRGVGIAASLPDESTRKLEMLFSLKGGGK